MRRRAAFLAWIGTRVGKQPGFERIMRFLMPPAACADLPEVCLLRDESLFLTRPALLTGWHVTFFGTYEPELRRVMKDVLRPGGVAIDVGANAGWHTLLLARLVGPRGRVLAIEPNPSVGAQLARNVALNRLSQVEILSCAAAEAERTVDFLAPDAADPACETGHVLAPAEVPQSIRVAARTLDAIVAERALTRLDLVKIDTEGFEWPVLRGGERSIARFRPVVLFEFDSATAPRGGGSRTLIADYFRRHGYRVLAPGRTGARPVEPDAWPDGANLMAVPAEAGNDRTGVCAPTMAACDAS